jgi:hypothetical protein
MVYVLVSFPLLDLPDCDDQQKCGGIRVTAQRHLDLALSILKTLGVVRRNWEDGPFLELSLIEFIGSRVQRNCCPCSKLTRAMFHGKRAAKQEP